MNKYCLIRSQAVGLFLLALSSVSGQSNSIPLQRVQFMNRLVESRLKKFNQASRVNFISVSVGVDSADGGYVYYISPTSDYEEVERFKSSKWGKWGDQVILFYARVDLEQICRITDTTALSNLKRYAEKLIPRSITRVPGTTILQLTGGVRFAFYMHFKIVKGRELYYYDSSGYDSREDPIVLPPAPETSKEH